MSNKSGVSTQVINVPTGGGALSGIGEKFAPDLHTGTGNFTIPIALPSGRNGFQPELNLVYSTGNPNGPFGLGWQLSIPNVSRKTSKGVPRYQSEDVFLLSGAEDLVETERIGNRNKYRPRTEGLFAIIERVLDAQNDYWEVRTKDGLISRYGRPDLRAKEIADSEVCEQENTALCNNATCRDPLNLDRVFNWMLTETRDPFGNKIEYTYRRDESSSGRFPYDYLYCHKIEYIDFPDPENPEGERFLVSVHFEYENRTLADTCSEYRSGFEMRIRQRCKSIVVRTHADKTRQVRRYDFRYTPDKFTTTSLLTEVVVTGIDESQPDGQQEQRLPPITFSYTTFEPEQADYFPVRGKDLPPRSLANPEIELADMFGNGLPDIVEMNGQIRYWRNLGNGEFDIPRIMREAPAGVSLEDPGVQFIDADGDGRIDLLVNRDNVAGYYPMQPSGEWDRRSFQRHQVRPSFPLEGPETKLVDLTGDGITDVIRSSSRMECFFNDKLEGWKESRSLNRRDIDDFPNINFSNPHVKWGDLSGSNLEHPILIYDGNVDYWPSLGYGDFGAKVHMENSPRFPRDFDPRRIIIGDVNGDGVDDIVYVDHCRVLLWINQSGKSWSEPIEIDGTPELTDPDGVRLVDLLGYGVSGLLWTSDATRNRQSNLFFLDFTNGTRPRLLREMDNNMGAITRVAYRSSVEDYLRSQNDRNDSWKTNLPFPVQVVGKVEVIDVFSSGKLTTLYQYHHGYWDGGEREFRGFGRVEQIDSEDFDRYNAPGLLEDRPFQELQKTQFTPPTMTKTWFHQGPIGHEFGEWTELDYTDEYWSEDTPKLTPFEQLGEYRSFEAFRRDGDIPRRVKRDLVRSLRGRVMRTELYALDGSTRQERPYTVTEAMHASREVFLDLDVDARTYGRASRSVFFPFTLAQRTTQWERGTEPLHSFSVTEGFDEFGLPHQQTSVACPRGWRSMDQVSNDIVADKEHLRRYLATRSVTDYARETVENVYIKDRVSRSTSFELKDQGDQTLTEFILKPLETEIIAHSLSYYDGTAFQGLPLGQVGRFGAPVRSEMLVIDENLLQQAYGDTLTPYLRPEGPEWTEEYPQAFRVTMPPLAGYVFYEGDAAHPRGYYSQTGRQQYDFQSDDPTIPQKGLSLVAQDSLGTTTEIVYDRYHFLPERVIDAVGLQTTAQYDYRIFQPELMTDINGNQQAFTFTPLALLASISVMGKPREELGDTLATPGTRFTYDFEAFINTREVDTPQPISVHTVVREYHITDDDPDIPESDRNNTIERREFSDGNGRLLQTRAQAEDVLFGNALFGEEVIAADQSVLPNRIEGRERNANDPQNVVVSGWQIYDNKGQVVIKYEPFYSQGFSYHLPLDTERGRQIRIFYDPLSRNIRTLNPDDSEQKMVYGIPVRLDDPDLFTPTPWEVYTYDENDNAQRTHGSGDASHFDTPSNIIIDALGRTVESIVRNGPNEEADWYRTGSRYDIRGNLLEVQDAFERKAFTYVYDLTFDKDNGSRVWKTDNIDAGVRIMILDVIGNEVEHRDAKQALTLQAYDILHRPTKMWARDGQSDPVRLCGLITYGDGGSRDQSAAERSESRAANRLRKVHLHYDEAGKCIYTAHDFKGNLLEKTRVVISDEAITSVFQGWDERTEIAPFRVDWQASESLPEREADLLETKQYTSSSDYDALNRIKRFQYPEDVENKRRQLLPRYNRAGALREISLMVSEDEPIEDYVQHIAYNANGQRTFMAYGNGIVTAHHYDERFRLKRLFTAAFQRPDPEAYVFIRPNDNKILQDCVYTYDLVSNIVTMRHAFPQSGIKGADSLVREFTYDPVYRLLSATGRENDTGQTTIPWLRPDGPPNNDPKLTCGYREKYTYDKLGNVLHLNHQSFDCNKRAGFNRFFTMKGRGRDGVSVNNQLQTMQIGKGASSNQFRYIYDANGNMSQEGCTRHFLWDHSDRLKAFVNQIKKEQADCEEQLWTCDEGALDQPASAEQNGKASIFAHYLYDSAGMRVKKLVRCQGGKLKSTVYIDDVFEYQRNGDRENNLLHIMDGEQRIALLRIGKALEENDPAPPVRYQIGDHLGSSNVVVDGNGGWTNREEFTPYGEGSFGGYKSKNYMYIAKEKDFENKLYYSENRFFNSFILRWSSVDKYLFLKDSIKKRSFYFINCYDYSFNNPIVFKDTTGLDPEGVAPIIMDNSVSREARERIFAFLHPIAAIDIRIGLRTLAINYQRTANLPGNTILGSPSDITKDPFAINVPNNGTNVENGSLRNAFRHTLWQAFITRGHGKHIAAEIGYAHELIPSIDLSKRSFEIGDNPSNALFRLDTVADLLNNKIGRTIAENNPDASQKELALLVLEEFRNKGLYAQKGQKDGALQLGRVKLSQDEYERVKEALENSDGLGHLRQSKQADQ